MHAAKNYCTHNGRIRLINLAHLCVDNVSYRIRSEGIGNELVTDVNDGDAALNVRGQRHQQSSSRNEPGDFAGDDGACNDSPQRHCGVGAAFLGFEGGASQGEIDDFGANVDANNNSRERGAVNDVVGIQNVLGGETRIEGVHSTSESRRQLQPDAVCGGALCKADNVIANHHRRQSWALDVVVR